MSPYLQDLLNNQKVQNGNLSPLLMYWQIYYLAYIYWKLWQYWLWSFQAGGTKLKKKLHKNQHTQRKLLNFEFWINGDLSKIGHHFSSKSIWKINLSNNVNNKKCASKLVFLNEFEFWINGDLSKIHSVSEHKKRWGFSSTGPVS